MASIKEITNQSLRVIPSEMVDIADGVSVPSDLVCRIDCCQTFNGDLGINRISTMHWGILVCLSSWELGWTAKVPFKHPWIPRLISEEFSIEAEVGALANSYVYESAMALGLARSLKGFYIGQTSDKSYLSFELRFVSEREALKSWRSFSEFAEAIFTTSKLETYVRRISEVQVT